MQGPIKMPQKDVRKLQLIELDILLELDRICRKNNIQYVLCGGTMIGVIRHEGFIPWDDDVDTIMTRKEFEKFEKACQKDLNHDKYFLQTYKSDKEYRWGYVKLRRKGTEYLRWGQEAIKCFSGVSIDIFIHDNVPDSRIGRIAYHYIRRGCIKTLYSVVGATQDKSLWKRFIYRGLRHIKKEIPLQIMEFLARMSNRKKTEYMYCMSFYRVDKFGAKNDILHRAIRSDLFEDIIEMDFEGFPFYVFKDYNAYLASNYGNRDIWKYPPESQRIVHPPRRYYLDVDIDLRGKNIEEYMNKEYIYKTGQNGDKV